MKSEPTEEKAAKEHISVSKPVTSDSEQVKKKKSDKSEKVKKKEKDKEKVIAFVILNNLSVNVNI